jgi:hypothetical protein
VWLAMKLAAAAGQVEVLGLAPDDAMPFGVQIIVHATARGPRRAVAISESLVDGIIAAFHGGASAVGAAAAAAALTGGPRLTGLPGKPVMSLCAISGYACLTWGGCSRYALKARVSGSVTEFADAPQVPPVTALLRATLQ